jgi:hypothetical protein
MLKEVGQDYKHEGCFVRGFSSGGAWELDIPWGCAPPTQSSRRLNRIIPHAVLNKKNEAYDWVGGATNYGVLTYLEHLGIM